MKHRLATVDDAHHHASCTTGEEARRAAETAARSHFAEPPKPTPDQQVLSKVRLCKIAPVSTDYQEHLPKGIGASISKSQAFRGRQVAVNQGAVILARLPRSVAWTSEIAWQCCLRYVEI